MRIWLIFFTIINFFYPLPSPTFCILKTRFFRRLTFQNFFFIFFSIQRGRKKGSECLHLIYDFSWKIFFCKFFHFRKIAKNDVPLPSLKKISTHSFELRARSRRKAPSQSSNNFRQPTRRYDYLSISPKSIHTRILCATQLTTPAPHSAPPFRTNRFKTVRAPHIKTGQGTRRQCCYCCCRYTDKNEKCIHKLSRRRETQHYTYIWRTQYQYHTSNYRFIVAQIKTPNKPPTTQPLTSVR